MSVGSNGSSRHLVPAASSLFARAFADDPVIDYMLSSMSPARRAAYLPRYINRLITAAALNHARIDGVPSRTGNASEEKDGEGGKAVHDDGTDWKSCGVLMLPGKRVNNPWTMVPAGLLGATIKLSFGGLARMLQEYPTLVNAAKKKGLKNQKKYYYVFFVGTDTSARKQGLCSSILRKYQAVAASEGLPIWLESSTENSMRLYSKLGWELVEEIVLGRWKGKELTKGDGAVNHRVKLWAMVWWPPGTKM